MASSRLSARAGRFSNRSELQRGPAKSSTLHAGLVDWGKSQLKVSGQQRGVERGEKARSVFAAFRERFVFLLKRRPARDLPLMPNS
jgi:hypothetical protein